MKHQKWCVICARPGHLSHACPDGEYMRANNAAAMRLQASIHDDTADSETARLLVAELTKEQPCTDLPSSQP